jgi:hypothetical protein
MEIQDQTEETVEKEDLYEIDHEIWLAREVNNLGFPVAGFIHEIYLDAVVLIAPLFRFDWGKRNVKVGRVISLDATTHRDDVCHFVLLLEDGTQVPCSYGGTYPCYFALPENTQDLFKKVP